MCRMLVLVALSLAILAACDTLSYSECDHGPNPVYRIDSANINPTVVRFPGEITPTVQVTVLRPITGNFRLDITVYKRVWFSYIKIPCVSQIGSCSYNVCDLLPYPQYDNEMAQCPLKLQNGNFNCTCPFPPGIYVVKDETFQIPKLPRGLGWLASGEYAIRSKLTDTATREVGGCYDMRISIKE